MKIERITIYKKLQGYVGNLNKQIAQLSIVQLLLAVLLVIIPLVYTYLINEVMITKTFINFKYVIAGYICIFAAHTILIVINKRMDNRTFTKTKVRLKHKLLKQYTELPLINYVRYDTGDLANRIDNDIDVIIKFYKTHLIGTCFSIIIVIAMGGLLFYLNWILALVSCISIPITYMVVKFISIKVEAISGEYREKYGEYETFLFDSLQKWKDIKSNNMEYEQDKIMLNKWNRLSKLFVKKQIFAYCNLTFVAIKDLFITNVNLYFIGGILVIKGYLGVGILLAFINYYSEFYSQISVIMSSVIEFKNDKASINRVIEILDIDLLKKKHVRIKNSDITIENVSFGYQDGRNILNQFNLHLLEKKQYALVGKSGCGKTTLINLILGEYAPDAGNIYIGGYNISVLSPRSIHKKVGVVMQEPLLFNLSIMDNFRMVNKYIAEDKIRDICEKVNIASFIEKLPKKYDTIIGERGIKLSGGQKQRLSIARTLIQNTDIIIMDESTSSLDGENEKIVMELIEKYAAGKIIITISHRLSTIMYSDCVITIEDGRITGQGHWKQLLKDNAMIQHLFGKEAEAYVE